MAASPQKSGSSGDTQKQQPIQSASAKAGAGNLKGGASYVASGPKAGPRPQKSGSSGG